MKVAINHPMFSVLTAKKIYRYPTMVLWWCSRNL